MRARRLLNSAALALTVSASLTACATAAPREGARLTDDVRRLVALLTLRRDEFSDLRTVADVTVRRGPSLRRLAGVLLVKPPTSVRFEALSPFGQPFLLLTISGGTLTTYNVADNQSLSGPVSVATTGRWLGVPLEPEALVGLLIGRVVPPPDLQEAEILPSDGLGPSLRLVGGDRSERVWMDFETGEVRRVEILGGRTTLVVTYIRASDGDLPADVHATASGTEFEATVRYHEPVLATGIDPERFRLAVPEGANVQRFY